MSEGLLKDKVCLVTGASRGIGAAVVRRFAGEGAVVYANARSAGSIDASCGELSESFGTRVYPLYFDVRDEAAATEAVVRIRKECGRLDVLVNNAGIMKDALLGMISSELVNEVLATNVGAVITMMQLAVRLMSRQGSGSIINLSSIAGTNGAAGQVVYSASKGAVAALTRSAARELAPRRIRVNAVAPGMIETDLLKALGPEKLERRLQDIGLGRFGTPEEVAEAIVFLASDRSSYITGEILGINGMTVL